MPVRLTRRPARFAAALGGLSFLMLTAACNERAPEPPAPVLKRKPGRPPGKRPPKKNTPITSLAGG